MDYSYLDALFDSVFVLNEEKGIVYCNEIAAGLCESSVRRLTKGKVIHDVLSFSNPDLFLMPNGNLGKDAVFPTSELHFKLVSGTKEGKAQVTIYPFSEPDGTQRWICVLRDVSLEEVLQGKYHAQLEQKQVVIDQLQQAQVQLEAYSKNLEHMVEERTQEVKRAHGMLKAIMNSLGQGFLVFDTLGECGMVFTKACEDVLEGTPAGRKIWDVLRLEAKEAETFKMWMGAVFGQKLSFDSLKDLAPSGYQHSKGRHIRLDYFPIHSEAGSTTHVVVVATDFTAEFEANIALENERHYAKMVVKLVTNRNQIKKFLENYKLDPQAILDMANDRSKVASFDHEWAFRLLHTLEGEAGTYGLEGLRKATRPAQEVIEPVKKGQCAFTEVRTTFITAIEDLLKARESFMNEQNELLSAVGLTGSESIEVSGLQLRQCMDFLVQNGLSLETVNFVEGLLKSRPVFELFKHYDDMAHSVAEKLGKKLGKIDWRGTDIFVNTDYLSPLASTFVHVFRNMVDHGIEPWEERQMMGKTDEGKITFSFEQFKSGGQDWYRFTVSDDGQGIHPEAIKAKLSKTGKAVPPDISDQDLIQVIFDAGFSTRGEVGEFSGRGVGLNALHEEARRLGGFAKVESIPGQGSTIIVEVPKTYSDKGLRLSA